MNKEFVPYEEALALKELGFNEPCFAIHSKIHGLIMGQTSGVGPLFEQSSECLAPTYSQAFRWFRDNHNLFSIINFMGISSYCVTLQLDTEEWRRKLTPNGCLEEIVDLYSHEEAELACLRKLIEIVKIKKETNP